MKRLLKWVGYIIGGIVVLILVFVGVIYAITSTRIAKTYPTQVEPVAVATDSGTIERGRHLTQAVGKCMNCHGDNLAGKMMADDPVFARLWATNLTRGKGGVGASYTDADYVRSIRYGVRSNGKPVFFMPSEAYIHFNDSDLGAIIAYVKSVPPVDQVIPKPSIGPIARTLSVLTEFPLLPARMIDRDAPRPAHVAIGVTKEYGDYLLKTGGCTSCHNPNLSGGGAMQGVKVPNLTPAGIGRWSEADFIKALRTGVRPDGRILSAAMPWPYTRYLTDDEIRAMWMYLQSLPARPAGG
ncbi:MAG: cytochrome c [Gemmatimonadota bacterium]|nr:cytochrome c [Gemmatimonadota bacterium]